MLSRSHSELPVKEAWQGIQEEGTVGDTWPAVDGLAPVYLFHPVPHTHGLRPYQNAYGSPIHSMWFYDFLLSCCSLHFLPLSCK